MHVLILVDASKADYSTDPQDETSCASMENTSLAQSSEAELEYCNSKTTRSSISWFLGHIQVSLVQKSI